MSQASGPLRPPEDEGMKINQPPGGPAQTPIGGGEEAGKAFKPLMEEGQQGVSEQVTSPMDLAKGGGPIGAGEATPASLQAQMETIGKKVGLLQGEMTESRYGELTPGQKALLDAKTGQLTDHINAIANYTGAEAPKEPDAGLSQLKKWIGTLVNAQGSMAQATGALSITDPSELSAAKMMQVQARLMAADRTVNFMSAVVGKSVDFVKQIFQMQI